MVIRMKKIGVIGSGTMGRGVALIFAKNDYQVILVDNKEEVLELSRTEISNMVRIQQIINKSLEGKSSEEVISNIVFTTDYSQLIEMDFVIENVTEKIEVKQAVYQEIDSICKKDTIFAANTSCIPVTELGAFTQRPKSVIGIHFMNPVPMMKAAEVMIGFHTGEDTVKAAKELLSSVQVEPILIKDHAGFVSNRISHLMMNEAAYIVQEQEASKEAVDEVFRKCYGHKMGPLETADLIGIDTVVDSLDVLYHYYRERKFVCCPLLRRMVQAGLLGRKSGEGFFKY